MQRTHTREKTVERNVDEVTLRNHDEIEDLADDSLQRAQNALSTLVRTDQIADATLEELDLQGEKLKNIQEGVDNIAYQQKLAERHERSIRSFWGWLYNMFVPPPVYVDNTKKEPARATVAPDAANKVSVTTPGVSTLFNKDDRSLDVHLVEAKIEPKNARQKMAEVDKHLADMNNVLGGLQRKSVVMNDELVKQTDQAKVLNKTTTDANVKFDVLNRKVLSL